MRQLGFRGHLAVMLCKILHRRLQHKRMMRTNVVASVLSFPHGLVQGLQIQLAHVTVMELFSMSSLRPVHMTVELQ